MNQYPQQQTTTKEEPMHSFEIPNWLQSILHGVHGSNPIDPRQVEIVQRYYEKEPDQFVWHKTQISMLKRIEREIETCKITIYFESGQIAYQASDLEKLELQMQRNLKAHGVRQ